MNTLQKTAIAAAISGLFAPAVFAQATPAPEASPVTANVTVVSDYRFRGISQSNQKPAIQGGFDYAHESGFYVGNWNSSISWISDGNPSVSAPIEMNFYGGFKKELIAPGFACCRRYPCCRGASWFVPSNRRNPVEKNSFLRF